MARAAGLSRATVSYVLNDAPNQSIPPATRRRVLDAAAALGYTPSAAARALRTGRSDVVLCLLPDWPIGPSIGQFLEQVSAALAARGLTFVVHPRARNARPVAEVWKAITPAAVVTMADLDPADSRAIDDAGIAVRLALYPSSGRGRAESGRTHQRPGRVQAEHLVQRGHRRLGYAFPDDPRLLWFAEPRLAGVLQACADLGLPAPVVRTVPLDPAAAEVAVAGWRSDGVTAVCGYNDDVALAVLAGLRRLGLAAPGDLAVVGVDDIPAAALAYPPLTTVSTDQRAVAEHIALRIVCALAGEPPPRRPAPDAVHLIPRAST